MSPLRSRTPYSNLSIPRQHRPNARPRRSRSHVADSILHQSPSQMTVSGVVPNGQSPGFRTLDHRKWSGTDRSSPSALPYIPLPHRRAWNGRILREWVGGTSVPATFWGMNSMSSSSLFCGCLLRDFVSVPTHSTPPTTTTTTTTDVYWMVLRMDEVAMTTRFVLRVCNGLHLRECKDWVFWITPPGIWWGISLLTLFVNFEIISHFLRL